MSLNGGFDSLAQRLATAPVSNTMPVHTNLMDPKSLPHTMASAAQGLNKTKGTAQAGQLLGGLPLGD
ncbi:hypothetical protein [Streptomyces sp. NPDC050485]|uniref:hypothetical protein n=1 Tax=Streptomyces sp. NPDC050485 TaxID=3365617 RepID=UPI0037A0DAB6